MTKTRVPTREDRRTRQQTTETSARSPTPTAIPWHIAVATSIHPGQLIGQSSNESRPTSEFAIGNAVGREAPWAGSDVLARSFCLGPLAGPVPSARMDRSPRLPDLGIRATAERRFTERRAVAEQHSIGVSGDGRPLEPPQQDRRAQTRAAASCGPNRSPRPTQP